MLIICNGAFKSGSTWVYALVHSILGLKRVSLSEIPEKYGVNNSPVFRIQESRLLDFVYTEDIQSSNYLTKAHFFRNDTLAFSYPDRVKFIFVERDLGDAVVSHYHHFLIYKKLNISFNAYYWIVGRFKAYEIWLFNSRCRKNFGQENLFIFEKIKADLGETISRLAQILEVTPLTSSEIQLVAEGTDIEVMRKRAQKGDRSFYSGAGKRNDELFRKGAVGDHSEYLTPSASADLNKIRDGKFSLPGRLVYQLMFTIRRKITIFRKRP